MFGGNNKMTEHIWRPQKIYGVYLTKKEATSKLKEPDKGICNPSRTIDVPGFELGFECKLPTDYGSKNGYQYGSEGLVVSTKKQDFDYYKLEVAPFKKPRKFEEFSWKQIDQTAHKTADGEFVRTNTFRFTQDHPYEGPVDSVMAFGFDDYEVGPRRAFEAFFHQGKLVAGWNENVDRTYKKNPLTNSDGLKDLLNSAGQMPHPSEQQVKEYLRDSNLPRELLTRFKEFLIE